MTKIYTLVILAIFITGCGSVVKIYSTPSGAKIYRNGINTGLMTPAKMRIRNWRPGTHNITVEKQGYRSVPRVQGVDIRLSIGNIMWSWWPPVLIKNLVGNRWKGITHPRGGRLDTFYLEKEEKGTTILIKNLHG